jgi:oligosaccharide repeat unit polymerase
MLQFKTSKNQVNDLLIIIAIQCSITILSIVLGLFYWYFPQEAEPLIYPACCFLLALSVWFFWSWQLVSKSLFHPYIIFLVAAILFNGGQTILEVFHLNEHGLLDGMFFSSETLLQSIYLVALGLNFFHLGALLAIGLSPIPKSSASSTTISDKSKPRQPRNTYIVGCALVGISIVPTILVVCKSISVAFSSGYTGIYQQELTTGLSGAPAVLSGFLVPASLFILAGSKKGDRGRILSVIFICLYSLGFFLIGERNKAVMPLIALAWLWDKLVGKISRTFLLSFAGVLTFIVFPFIAINRNSQGGNRLSWDALMEQFTGIENPAIASLQEMGGSMMTIAYTLELVPREREFQLGADYFYALFILIPNLFWDIHPTIARGIAGNWLTWEINPYNAYRGGGLGYSFIAEAYLNFGWLGTPLVLGVMGFCYSKLLSWGIKLNHPAKMAAIASFTAFVPFCARAESIFAVRTLFWYSLIPYLGVLLFDRLRSNN